jgi:ankyrin repeat protein
MQNGWTPLSSAAYDGLAHGWNLGETKETAAFLLDNGADPDLAISGLQQGASWDKVSR